ncbi:MAG TPA: rod shape-determining protein MreD [Candidatus Dormibacteraeota bacterium]|nr:rod shape-determining protein MreD [Candidatus Dormibacteraeota bacterium]
MRRAAGVVLMAVAALVQVTWAPRVEVAGAFPNLVLVAVVAITWASGVRAALVWSCVGGTLLDLTSTGAIGPHALALMVGAYTVGLGIHNLERVTPVRVVFTAVVATALYSVVLMLADNLLGLPVPAAGVAFQLAIAAAAYNAVLSPLAFEALRRLPRSSSAAAPGS